MTNLMYCIGRTPAHPYEWDALEVRVYSIEELCFYIVRNRYMLTADAFSPELAEWIENECGLPDLALSIRRRLDARADVTDLATIILEYVRFNSEEEINETRRVLRDSTDMNVYEKSLARADFLMENEHFHQAVDAYEDLRRSIDAEDRERHARILYGEGVMHARMFSFAQAAECFYASYELSERTETYLSYLAARRMQMTEKDYLDFISRDAKGYELSMALEKRISDAEAGYGLSDEYRRARQLKQLKNEGKTTAYYDMAESVVESLKQEYRGTRDVVVRN